MASVSTRTGKTFLTDDELLLFDFLAMFFGVPRGVLRRTQFAEHAFSRSSHGLDDDALDTTLLRLAEAQLVVSHIMDIRGRPTQMVTLTIAGGELWEIERQPDWTRYCLDYCEENGVDLVCLSMDTARHYIEDATACGLLDPAAELVEVIEHRPAAYDGRALFNWKPFALSFECRLRWQKPSRGESNIDWKALEARRTWWRDTGELLSLRCE